MIDGNPVSSSYTYCRKESLGSPLCTLRLSVTANFQVQVQILSNNGEKNSKYIVKLFN